MAVFLGYTNINKDRVNLYQRKAELQIKTITEKGFVVQNNRGQEQEVYRDEVSLNLDEQAIYEVENEQDELETLDGSSVTPLPARLTMSEIMADVQSTDVSENDDIRDIINLGDVEFIEQLIALNSERNNTSWILGGLMANVIQTKRFASVYPDLTIREFIEQTLGVNERTMYMYAACYTRFTNLGLTADHYRRIGTAKANKILKYMDDENKLELIERAYQMSTRDLDVWLKENFESDVLPEVTTGNVSSISFKVFEDQKDAIEAAFKLAESLSPEYSESSKLSKGQLLVSMLTDWVHEASTGLPQTEEQLISQLEARHPGKKVIFSEKEEDLELN